MLVASVLSTKRGAKLLIDKRQDFFCFFFWEQVLLTVWLRLRLVGSKVRVRESWPCHSPAVRWPECRGDALIPLSLTTFSS